jgi:hypothetical protein
VGPGGPHDRGAVIVDARNAILMDSVGVSTVDSEGGDPRPVAIVLELSGRINQTQDRASVLFIFGSDGAAAIITELLGLYGRGGLDAELLSDLTERLNTLAADGNLYPPPD